MYGSTPPPRTGTPEIFLEYYSVATKKAIRHEKTKPQARMLISLWFCGLLARPDLFCDCLTQLTFLKYFKFSRFSQAHYNSKSMQVTSYNSFCRQFAIFPLPLQNGCQWCARSWCSYRKIRDYELSTLLACLLISASKAGDCYYTKQYKIR